MIYGYCRVSTTHQRITRQVNNILNIEPKATIVKEFFTGTTQSRPQWEKLLKQLLQRAVFQKKLLTVAKEKSFITKTLF